MQLASSVREKKTIEDTKRGKLEADFKREKTVSERRTDETKSLRLHSVQESCMSGVP